LSGHTKILFKMVIDSFLAWDLAIKEIMERNTGNRTCSAVEKVT